ncbi:MAG: alpha/beta fold hydrolase [Gammaproteobacteria bacterium]|nr:alpha/beta fold hydrolase [Gammaproteobacteria bacterium]
MSDDLAQLIDQEELAPVQIIAHSMGGNIASIYAGTYPENVASFTSIEGVGGIPMWYRGEGEPQEKIRDWIDQVRKLAGRSPRRYESLGEALQRMQKSNPHLQRAASTAPHDPRQQPQRGRFVHLEVRQLHSTPVLPTASRSRI